MISPILRIRRELGLSQIDLALLARVQPAFISRIENGDRINRTILHTLAELGYDSQEVQREHTQFVEEKRRRLLAELQHQRQIA